MVSPAPEDDERQFEAALRPTTLADFAGQPHAREQLAIAIEAAKRRGEAMDHVLLCGPPGLGKTTLAGIIAHELTVPMDQTAGPVLQKKLDLTGILSSMRAQQVFFVDEIHRLLPDIEGMDKRGYVPDLFEHLACADAAIVQGGLSTTMELVATGRPFIYFPLRRHWEQQHFVTHRLHHYRAGLRMDYTTTTADQLALTMRTALAEAGTRPGYRKIPRGGADRAAARIATLLRGQQ